MTKLIVDASLPDKLANLVQPVELCDATGRVLGRYFPQLDPSAYNLEPKISEDEIRRRTKSDKWYTTEEVLAHLQSLEKE
jgi:hypothetical protein